MIKIAAEELVPLSRVPHLIPTRLNGRPIHVATVYRWAQLGIRGIRLETVKCGKMRATSINALQRFFDRLRSDADLVGSTSQPSVAQARRRRKIAETHERLESKVQQK